MKMREGNMISQFNIAYPLNKYCPLYKKPFDNCYCVTMESHDVEKAIFYCTSNFNSCPIYKTGYLPGKPGVYSLQLSVEN